MVRSYLAARWRDTAHVRAIDDAVQDVFVDCFKEGGALGRAQQDRPSGFRSFLHGVVRNVARRVQERDLLDRERQPPADLEPEELGAYEAHLSRVFDRSWAESRVRQAVAHQRERGRSTGGAARRRVELLDLRFYQGLKIRDIARRWNADPAELHHEYARARRDFRAALFEVVAFHLPHSREAVERECVRLLAILRG